MDRAFVWIVAAILALAGASYLVSPTAMTASAGISADASGLTDIRATYGGFQIGIAIFLAWCARSPDPPPRVEPVLMRELGS